MAAPIIFNGAYAKLLTNALRMNGRASDPSSAVAGDVYYNTVSNKLKVYTGGAWTTLDTTTATITNWTTFTPTVGGCGTCTNVLSKWRQVGQNYEIISTFQTGTVTAFAATFQIPNSGTSSTTLLPLEPQGPDTAEVVGRLIRGVPTSQVDLTVICAPGATVLRFGFVDFSLGASGMFAAAGNTLFNNNEFVTFMATVPIDGL